MPSASFTYRFLLDSAFYELIRERARNNKDNPTLMFKLMNINAQSREHRRMHNAMSSKAFNEIMTNHSISYTTLRSAFYPLSEPHDIENIDDEIERNIKHAIDLATDTPYKLAIMTSDENKTKYQTNGHFQNSPRNITVISGEDAVDLISLFYSQCARI